MYNKTYGHEVRDALFDAHGHYHRVRREGAAWPQDTLPAGICCGTSPADWSDVTASCTAYPVLRPAYGVHPWFLEQAGLDDAWQTLRQCLLARPDALVGEIGLDYGPERPDADLQRAAFCRQLSLACELGRPVSVHCVRAWGDLLAAWDALSGQRPTLLVHDFRSSPEMAADLTRREMFLSFQFHTEPIGKRAPAAVRAVPANLLLVETDVGGRPAAPVQPTEDLVRVIEQLADWRGQHPLALARQLAANAQRYLGTG